MSAIETVFNDDIVHFVKNHFYLGTIKSKNKILKKTKHYFEYSTNKKNMSQYGMHRTTLAHKIKQLRNGSINIPIDDDYHRFIFLDGKGTENICTLIARDKHYVFKFQHVLKENAENGQNFIKSIEEPEAVVLRLTERPFKNNKKHLAKVKMQFCNFHKVASIDHKLTKNSIFLQATELRQIRLMFAHIRSFKEKYEFMKKCMF